MSRLRRDPRQDKAILRIGGHARPRYDRRAAPGPGPGSGPGSTTRPGTRPRIDPRAEHAALVVETAPRLRLDRTRPPRPASAPAAQGAPQDAASAPCIVTVENPDFWVLVLADSGDGRLSPVDRQVLGAARLLAGKAGGVVLAIDGAPADAGVAGADRLVTLPPAAHPQDKALAALAIIEILSPAHVMAAETADGGDLARRIAVATGQDFFPAVEQVSSRGVVRSLQGRGLDAVAARAAPVMTVMPEMILPHGADRREARPLTMPDMTGTQNPAAPDEAVQILRPQPGRVQMLRPQPGAVALAEADFVVSAGNGIQDFGLFRALATALGATPGGSRVVCDAGLLPRSAQVGASGTVLSADCYLALGIAGAPQHLQGIAGCEHVIAVNTDLHAAMVERAGLAIVADAQPVMAALLHLLQQEKGV